MRGVTRVSAAGARAAASAVAGARAAGAGLGPVAGFACRGAHCQLGRSCKYVEAARDWHQNQHVGLLKLAAGSDRNVANGLWRR